MVGAGLSYLAKLEISDVLGILAFIVSVDIYAQFIFTRLVIQTEMNKNANTRQD